MLGIRPSGRLSTGRGLSRGRTLTLSSVRQEGARDWSHGPLLAAGGLREFLRAWVGPDDAWVRPGDVGLPAGTGLRRTPGPRREVAAPAGASVDYYVRLEHGQETNPSPAALTRALLLD